MIGQILGFSPSGAPILPNTSNSTDQDVIRREKLGWDEISVQAAKIVSFIGRLNLIRVLYLTNYLQRLGWPREVSEDHTLWAHIWCTFLCHPYGWSKCRAHRHVERAFSDRSGAKRPCCGLHHEGLPINV